MSGQQSPSPSSRELVIVHQEIPLAEVKKIMMIVIITKKIMMIEMIMTMMMMMMNVGAIQKETPLAEIKDMMALWSSGSVTFAMFPNPHHPL